MKAERPDPLNYFNYMNDGGKKTICCTAMSRKLLTSPAVGDTYSFLMNTCNTLPESYQQRVYLNPVATIMCLLQQAENPMLPVAISVEAARIDNAIYLDYVICKVALVEPEIWSTDPNIPMDHDCTNDELYMGMPGGGRDSYDEGDETDKSNAIPTDRCWRRAVT